MPTPTDRNALIALAKDWTWKIASSTEPAQYQTDGFIWAEPHWVDAEGQPQFNVFDFVGTLAGVAGLMRELGPEWAWAWDGTQYVCCHWEADGRIIEEFCSPDDCPGNCVGDAYLNMKEAVDASTD